MAVCVRNESFDLNVQDWLSECRADVIRVGRGAHVTASQILQREAAPTRREKEEFQSYIQCTDEFLRDDENRELEKNFSLESKILFQSYKQYTNEFYREDVNREVEEIFLPESKNWVWTRIKNTYVRKKMTMTASSSLFLLNQYPVSERVETLNRKTCHKQHHDISKVEQRRYRSCIYRQACF